MAVEPERLATVAFCDYLRANLPAKVTAINALRPATLRARHAGPYVIPPSSQGLFQLSKTSRESFSDVFTTMGTRTAAQIASEINGTIPSLASNDDGYLVLTGDAPSGETPSVLALGPGGPGLNAALGWDAGGESVVNVPLVAPNHRGVSDGWPLIADMGPGFWVIVGDRVGVPWGGDADVRRDSHIVTLDVAIYYAPGQQEFHRNREPLHACVRCVRELLLTDAGRQLGRAATGDIMKVTVGQVKVSGRPWEFVDKSAPINPIYDVATMKVALRVFERPAAS